VTRFSAPTGASAAAGRPLRHALRACGVGAGPSGRADRAARRGMRSPQQLHSTADRYPLPRTLARYDK